MGNKMINTVADHDTGNIHRLYNWLELQQMYLDTIPAYVYYIRHVPTGKYYYGSRYNHIKNGILPEDDLWIKYFSSSKEVKKLLTETGIDSFETMILYKDVDTDACFEFEQTIIKENIKDPLCINKRYFNTTSGKMSYCVFGKTLSSKGKPKREDTKQKMRKPKTDSHKESIRQAQLRNGGNGPENHSIETITKIKDWLFANSAFKQRVTCPHCNKEGGNGPMKRFHFDNCKERNK